MTRKSLFGIGLQDKSLPVSAQGRLNLYLEFRPEEDGIRIVSQPTPGLTLFADFGDTPARGMHTVGSLTYVVHRGAFWEVTAAGALTNRGSLLTTTGRVYFADNGVSIMLVDGFYGYTFNTSTPGTPLAQIVDVDYVAANTVTWLDQYFIQDKVSSGRFYISNVGDPTAWSALDFSNAESNPDNLVRVFADHGELLLMGELTTEFWGASGAADFPFARLGSAVVEWGLAARESLTKFYSSLMFLGKNRLGEVQVVLLNGYTPQPVGGLGIQDFLYAINQYTSVADATAFSYMRNGHAFYQINFPTAGASWLYDGTSKVWSMLQSDTGRHRANISAQLLTYTIVSDYSNGRLYKLDSTVFTDNGVAIPREITGLTMLGENYIPISQLWADMETGVGIAGAPTDYTATNYLNLPGTAGDYASTPDSAALDITGDIDIIAYINPTSWTPASNGSIFSKWTTAGNQRAYRFFMTTGGNLLATTSTNGTATTADATSTIAISGAARWVRWTRDVDDGAGNHVDKFYTSTDAPSTAVAAISWTQLGATITTAGTTSIFNSTAIAEVGTNNAGTGNIFVGKIYSAYLYSGGTLVAAFNANTGSVGSSTWVSTTGETWTVNGAASLVQVPDSTGSIVVPATPGANPQVMLLVSEDRGRTWREVGWRTAGQTGDYENRVQWNRLGSSRSWTFKLRVTDPVKTSFYSEGWIQ